MKRIFLKIGLLTCTFLFNCEEEEKLHFTIGNGFECIYKIYSGNNGRYSFEFDESSRLKTFYTNNSQAVEFTYYPTEIALTTTSLFSIGKQYESILLNDEGQIVSFRDKTFEYNDDGTLKKVNFSNGTYSYEFFYDEAKKNITRSEFYQSGILASTNEYTFNEKVNTLSNPVLWPLICFDAFEIPEMVSKNLVNSKEIFTPSNPDYWQRFAWDYTYNSYDYPTALKCSITTLYSSGVLQAEIMYYCN